jgi:hypothetical protein
MKPHGNHIKRKISVFDVEPIVVTIMLHNSYRYFAVGESTGQPTSALIVLSILSNSNVIRWTDFDKDTHNPKVLKDPDR